MDSVNLSIESSSSGESISSDTTAQLLMPSSLTTEVTKSQPVELYGQNKNRDDLSHERNAYFTPRWLHTVIRKDIFGGVIDLDPATTNSNPIGALNIYTIEDNGLEHPWFGNVFCNPPYGRGASAFAAHAVNETLVKPDCRVVLLLAARPGSLWQQNVMRWATDILFLKTRLKFEREDGTVRGHAPFDSVLMGFNVSLARMRDYGVLCRSI